jgi:hypothetical protein
VLSGWHLAPNLSFGYLAAYTHSRTVYWGDYEATEACEEGQPFCRFPLVVKEESGGASWGMHVAPPKIMGFLLMGNCAAMRAYALDQVVFQNVGLMW